MKAFIKKTDANGKPIQWAIVIELGRDEGRRFRKWVYGKTKRAVEAKAKQLLEDQARGVNLRHKRQSVGTFLRRWIKTRPADIRPRTWESYIHIVEAFLIPHLGHLPIAQMNAGDIEDMLNQLQTERPDGKKPIAPSYAAKIRAVLSKALGRAQRENLVSQNAAGLVDAIKTPKRKKAALNDAQIRALLAAAVGERDEVLLHLLVKTGLRKGEALGIRWCDLDIDAGILTIAGSLQRQPRPNRADGEPKTAKIRSAGGKSDDSLRVLALPPSLLPLLRRRRIEQHNERAACEKLGKPWSNPDDLVFTTRYGTPIEPRAFHDRYKAIVGKAGLPPSTTIHDLRHANITAMITSKQVDPKTVQEMAGHADVRLTLDVYTHSDLDLQRAAADVIDRRFSTDQAA